MKKQSKNSIFYFLAASVFAALLVSCNSREKEVKEEKIISPKPLTALEQKTEIRYRYKGELYKDPFVTPLVKKVFLGSITEDEIGEMPILGSLGLTGIVKDKINRLAVLSGPGGTWFLKNDKLYDKKGRRVKGIRGEIGENSVNLITEDNFSKTIKLHDN